MNTSSFYQFWNKVREKQLREAAPAPAPAAGGAAPAPAPAPAAGGAAPAPAGAPPAATGTAAPVPPPDPNVQQIMQLLPKIQDKKVSDALMKALQGAGVQTDPKAAPAAAPGAKPAAPAPAAPAAPGAAAPAAPAQ